MTTVEKSTSSVRLGLDSLTKLVGSLALFWMTTSERLRELISTVSLNLNVRILAFMSKSNSILEGRFLSGPGE